MKRKLTRPALIAAWCVGIWALGLLWMWADFTFSHGVWTITPGPIILMLAMMLAAPTFFFACISLLRRKVNGLPVLTELSGLDQPAPGP